MHGFSRVVRVGSAFGLVLALGLLVACAPQPGASTGTDSATSPASGASIGTAPTVRLIQPAEGATVPAGTVTVAVETTGLEFVMPGTNVAGQGHVHFTLDDRPFVMSVEKQIELKDVEPGIHTLVAELVQNDTASFDPPVEQEISFVAE